MKRKEVVIEREETILLRGGTPVRGQQSCPICGPGTVMLTAEEASRLHGETVRSICRWAESGEVHSLDTPDGRLLVCLASLARRAAAVVADPSSGNEAGPEEKKFAASANSQALPGRAAQPRQAHTSYSTDGPTKRS